MIKLNPHIPPDPTLPPVITIQVSGMTDIKRFERTINNAINCRPEAGADLFTLADELHALIAQLEATA